MQKSDKTMLISVFPTKRIHKLYQWIRLNRSKRFNRWPAHRYADLPQDRPLWLADRTEGLPVALFMEQFSEIQRPSSGHRLLIGPLLEITQGLG
jgi:hypothetical protein